MTTTASWQKQPTESAIAFNAFKTYRDMGASRTLEKTREKLGKVSGYMRVLEDWSSTHRWVERAADYDAHMDELAQSALEQRIIARRTKLIEREIADADALLDKFDQVMEQVKVLEKRRSVRKKEGDQEIEYVFVEVNVEGLNELITLRQKLARFSRLPLGLPDRINQQQMTGADGGPVEIKWVDPLNEDDDIGIGADELSTSDAD